MDTLHLDPAPGITCFRQPMGARHLQFYALVDGDGFTLWDTALPGVVTGWQDTGQLGRVDRAIISHADADHLGDTAALRTRNPRLQVLCHAADRHWIEFHAALATARYDHARAEHDFGYDAATLQGLHQACGPDFPIDATLADGDVLAIGGRQWTVLHVPGHSPGHLALWSSVDGILLASDAVLGFGPPTPAGIPSMPSTHQFIANYLATIARLAELPVALVLTAHWPFMTAQDFRGFLAQSRQRVTFDLETIITACRQGPQGFADLVAILNERFRTWPESEDTHYMYALSGSLEYLMAQGALAKRDGLYVAS